MSCATCGSSSGCCCDANPCSHVPTQEGIASQIQNFITALFGLITVTLDNTGRGTWTIPCSPSGTVLPCIPPNAGEGYICYIIRIIQQLAVIANPIANSIWNIANSYCANTFVTDGISIYISKQAVPAGIAIGNATYWFNWLTPPAGPQGIQGPPGPAGGGSTPVDGFRTVTGNATLTNTDDVIYVNSVGAAVITIPLMNTLTAGKRFMIINEGAGNAVITPTAADVIGLPGSAGAATYTITTGESQALKSKNTAFWYV